MLVIDPDSPLPPFEQLRRQLLEQIATGEAAPGTRLPTVRRLAQDLGLASGTVARCYRELESSGAIVTRGRGGSFVAQPAEEAELEAVARDYAERARRAGLDAERALALVRRALRTPSPE